MFWWLQWEDIAQQNQSFWTWEVISVLVASVGRYCPTEPIFLDMGGDKCVGGFSGKVLPKRTDLSGHGR